MIWNSVPTGACWRSPAETLTYTIWKDPPRPGCFGLTAATTVPAASGRMARRSWSLPEQARSRLSTFARARPGSTFVVPRFTARLRSLRTGETSPAPATGLVSGMRVPARLLRVSRRIEKSLHFGQLLLTARSTRFSWGLRMAACTPGISRPERPWRCHLPGLIMSIRSRS
jgi:hypothetical protein